MQVKIISDDEVQRKVDKVLSKLMLDTQHIGLYAGTWREQMIEAVRFGDDEEEDEAGNPVPRAPFKGGPVAVTKRVIVYALMLPWKAFFALVPPPGLLSGWPCFVGALAVPRCKFESEMGTDEAGTAERRRAD